ncbi:hypothetical protein [uncultured Treponema sp.]|uniref:hypothetical protein n=1 Tax=uncultured Treponema sp. TaxID=162155 RepID=UPI0027D9C849|nr:hypothetical protein [uncultured Treponema sp.]
MYGYDEYGNLKYQSVVSERADNPTTEPNEGFIRLYFYSELSNFQKHRMHFYGLLNVNFGIITIGLEIK